MGNLWQDAGRFSRRIERFKKYLKFFSNQNLSIANTYPNGYTQVRDTKNGDYKNFTIYDEDCEAKFQNVKKFHVFLSGATAVSYDYNGNDFSCYDKQGKPISYPRDVLFFGKYDAFVYAENGKAYLCRCSRAHENNDLCLGRAQDVVSFADSPFGIVAVWHKYGYSLFDKDDKKVQLIRGLAEASFLATGHIVALTKAGKTYVFDKDFNKLGKCAVLVNDYVYSIKNVYYDGISGNVISGDKFPVSGGDNVLYLENHVLTNKDGLVIAQDVPGNFMPFGDKFVTFRCSHLFGIIDTTLSFKQNLAFVFDLLASFPDGKELPFSWDWDNWFYAEIGALKGRKCDKKALLRCFAEN